MAWCGLSGGFWGGFTRLTSVNRTGYGGTRPYHGCWLSGGFWGGFTKLTSVNRTGYGGTRPYHNFLSGDRIVNFAFVTKC
ncbi:hypothetical protein NIES39_L02550 [Arthrospira platensis NIES-39]|nr:hypothetical protein NIES39_L02550 [Arthrospira platensis NIES-39]